MLWPWCGRSLCTSLVALPPPCPYLPLTASHSSRPPRLQALRWPRRRPTLSSWTTTSPPSSRPCCGAAPCSPTSASSCSSRCGAGVVGWRRAVAFGQLPAACCVGGPCMPGYGSPQRPCLPPPPLQLTINLVALIVAVVAAISNGETPLNVLQLLWVNLIMDSLAALGECGRWAPAPCDWRMTWGGCCAAATSCWLCSISGPLFKCAARAWPLTLPPCSHPPPRSAGHRGPHARPAADASPRPRRAAHQPAHVEVYLQQRHLPGARGCVPRCGGQGCVAPEEPVLPQPVQPWLPSCPALPHPPLAAPPTRRSASGCSSSSTACPPSWTASRSPPSAPGSPTQPTTAPPACAKATAATPTLPPPSTTAPARPTSCRVSAHLGHAQARVWLGGCTPAPRCWR